MLTNWYRSCLLVVCASSTFTVDISPAAEAPDKPSAIQSGAGLDDGWETLNPRFEFLMKRYLDVETLLEEIEKRQHSDYWRRKRKEGEARSADRDINDWHIKGGAPVRWSKFYGKSIDAFYHQAPGRAAVIFDRSGDLVAISASQGTPQMKKRPPQFDYILDGHKKIKADAEREAEALGTKLDVLEARRRELEVERLNLLCQIAFREIQRRDLAQKSFYRFEPMAVDATADVSKEAEAMRAAVLLMSKVVRIVDQAEADQTKALRRIAQTVKGARIQLSDTWQRNGVLTIKLANNPPDLSNNRERFVALTKHLEEHGMNLAQSYDFATKDLDSNDETKLDAKSKVLDRLSESLIHFASVVVTMDETAIELAQEWKVQPNLNVALVVEDEAPVDEAPVEEKLAAQDKPVTESGALLGLREIRLKDKNGAWVSHAVSYDGGITYLALANGNKSALTLNGRELSWTGPKGAKRTLNVDSPDSSGAQLVFSDGRASEASDSAPTANKRKKRPNAKARGKR